MRKQKISAARKCHFPYTSWEKQLQSSLKMMLSRRYLMNFSREVEIFFPIYFGCRPRFRPILAFSFQFFLIIFEFFFILCCCYRTLLCNTTWVPKKKTLRAECDDKNMILLPRNEAEFRRAMRQNKMWKVLKEKKRKWNFHENQKILNIRHDTTAQQ